MHDPSGKIQELLEENSTLKQRIRELEQSEADRKRAEIVSGRWLNFYLKPFLKQIYRAY
jgi:hypothetical protein